MRLSPWLRSARSHFVPNGPTRRAKLAISPQLSVEQLDDRIVPSTFKVTNLADSGDGSLREAITAANTNPGADVIRFAAGVRGTIGLTSGELSITDSVDISGPGANKLAVSGSDASRVFNIGSGAVVSIDDLTIMHGRAMLRGGGILNAGTLTLSDAVVSDNVALGLPGATPASDAMGGGLLNNGTLTASGTLFVRNQSLGGAGIPGGTGSTGLGGAIMSAGTATTPSLATITDCTFIDNQAVGGASGAGATFSRAGVGGAITNGNGNMAISDSLFRDNRAVGGFGGVSPGGAGVGGAIVNVALLGNATLTVSRSTIIGNQAIGGAAAAGNSPQPGRGGGIANYVAPIATTPVTATATVTDCVILGNQAIGGAGATGGTGQGGGIANENGASLTVSNSLIALNSAIGGAGSSGNGGNGLGGGIFNGPANPFGAPKLTLDHTLVVLNQANGGASSGGSAGLGVGGGLYLAPGGVASADFTPIFANDASTSDDDVFGILI